MHPPFESQIEYLVTGSYVPGLPEGWPLLVFAAWSLYMYFAADRTVKRARAEHRRVTEEMARTASQEAQRRRQR